MRQLKATLFTALSDRRQRHNDLNEAILSSRRPKGIAKGLLCSSYHNIFSESTIENRISQTYLRKRTASSQAVQDS